MANQNINYSLIRSDSEDCFAEYLDWKWATGDCSWELYGGVWFNEVPIVIESCDEDEDEPDYNFYLVKVLHNIEEDLEEPEYFVTMWLVSLDCMSDDQLEDVAMSYDWDGYDYGAVPLKHKLADIVSYGYACHVWDGSSNDVDGYQELFKEADEVADYVIKDAESYLESSQNQLGHTGWHRVMGVF